MEFVKELPHLNGIALGETQITGIVPDEWCNKIEQELFYGEFDCNLMACCPSPFQNVTSSVAVGDAVATEEGGSG